MDMYAGINMAVINPLEMKPYFIIIYDENCNDILLQRLLSLMVRRSDNNGTLLKAPICPWK